MPSVGSCRAPVTNRNTLVHWQEEDREWKMSPSAFLPTMEEGSDAYRGQFSGQCAPAEGSPCPPSVTAGRSTQPRLDASGAPS